MTANDNSIYAVQSKDISESSLWLVESSNGKYALKNLSSGKYLNYQSNFFGYEIVMSDNKVYWNESSGALSMTVSFIIFSETYYLRYQNSGYSLTVQSNQKTNFSFSTASLNLSASPNPLVCGLNGANECFTVVSQATVNSRTFDISYNAASSNTGFYSPWKEKNQVCAYVAANSGTPKSAVVTVTNNAGTSIQVNVTQAVSAFEHQKGNSGRDLMENGMQGVHTERIVIYVPLGGSKVLELLEEKFTYSRWYQYDTDENVSVGSINIGGTQLNGNKGIYNASASNTTYRAPSSMPAGKDVNSDIIAEVACDLSYYRDMTTNTSGQVQIEPTLSQRVIYEIRPAQQMVTKLNSCGNTNGATNGNYLEEYNIIAPVGQTVRFGPMFEYQGSNNNYYTSNYNLASGAQWYKNGSAISLSPLNNRVVSTSHSKAETVIYTLVVGGKGIAKFTVNYKNVDEIGPKVGGVVSETALLED